jgi:hypothetical protein
MASKPSWSYVGPACPHCNTILATGTHRSGEARDIRCPACLKEFEAVFFDPPVEKARVLEIAATGPHGATPCAHHPGNAAVADCARCGSFICDLCVIELGGGSYCPGCFELVQQSGESGDVVGRFRDYGSMASGAATLGCLVYFVSFVIGPLAIYYGAKALRQKKKLNETDGLVGIWAAMVLGAIETAVGMFFVIVVLRELV